MTGQQSFLLNDIKNHLRHGGNVTHILNVKVSRQPDNETRIAIRQSIFERIANRPICLNVNGIPVTVKWNTSAKCSSAYYYADVPMFTDIVVKAHSKILLRNILNEIDEQFNQIFTEDTTGLALLVTRPLMREVAIKDEDDIGEHDEEAAEVDDVVERFDNI